MSDQFVVRRATRSSVNLLGALVGPSGSGKTFSSLRLARGLVGPSGEIVLIDTDNRRSELYADTFEFKIIELDPPFSPERFIHALEAAEASHPGAVILDTATHEWRGKGGVLELVDKMRAAAKNKFAPWAEMTPRHNAFVDRLIHARQHLIVTLRARDEYVMEVDEETGKKAPKKVGLGPEQRAGIEYEFQLSLMLDQVTNNASVLKDNTRCFLGRMDVLTERDGERLAAWCAKGFNPKEKAAEAYKRLELLLAAHAAKLGPEKMQTTVNGMRMHDADIAWLTHIADKIQKVHGPVPSGLEFPVEGARSAEPRADPPPGTNKASDLAKLQAMREGAERGAGEERKNGRADAKQGNLLDTHSAPRAE